MRNSMPIAMLALLLAASTLHSQGIRKLEPLFEELFLGEVIYPQDRGELQVTTGFLWNHRGRHDFRVPLLVEYGITDRFQLETLFPLDFQRTGPTDAEGIGNIELGAFYNFLNRPDTGTGLGIGFEVGFPTATTNVGERAFIYEPFFVVYQEFRHVAVNVSAGVEIEDATETGEETEVAGDLDIAFFRRFGQFVPLVELGIEIKEEAEVRLAPGVYWKPPHWEDAEIGIAFPIGLTRSTPDFGVFLQLNVEFGGEEESEGGEED